MPASRSAVSELTDGRFAAVLGDRESPPAETVRRVVLTHRQVRPRAIERRNKESAPVAVLRLEQLYPFPGGELRPALEPYPGAELVWAQEEPENMGAWRFVAEPPAPGARPRRGRPPVAREESGSPASGSQAVHDREQDDLLAPP